MADTLKGYVLKRNVTDNMGTKWKFGLYPDNCAGGINYFSSFDELSRFQRQVEIKRAWEEKYPLEIGEMS